MDVKAILGFLITCFAVLNGVIARKSLSKEADSRFNDEEYRIPNKEHIRKTFISHHGDIYDCVDIYKQKAFDHPLLKNHTIQMRPSFIPYSEEEEEEDSNAAENVKIRLPESCPHGSVPVLRLRKNVISTHHLFKYNVSADDDDPSKHLAGYVTKPDDIYGAQAFLNVWRVDHAIEKEQISAAEVRAFQKETPGKGLINCAMGGWMINPLEFGDSITRLFTAWTTDDFDHTGCLNDRCSGFITTARDMAPGMIIKKTSTYNGQQYATKVYVYMDFKTQYWWFAVNTEDDVLGYWPNIIFNNFERASQALFGGYVYDANLQQPPMGSGHMPDEGVNKAAYIRTMKVLPGGGTPKTIKPEMLEAAKIGSNCYGIGTLDYRGEPFEYTFFYGGPGNC